MKRVWLVCTYCLLLIGCSEKEEPLVGKREMVGPSLKDSSRMTSVKLDLKESEVASGNWPAVFFDRSNRLPFFEHVAFGKDEKPYKVLWKVTAFKNSSNYLLMPPVCSGGHLYWYVGLDGIAAHDAKTGNLKWHSVFAQKDAIGGGVALLDDNMFVNFSDGHLAKVTCARWCCGLGSLDGLFFEGCACCL